MLESVLGRLGVYRVYENRLEAQIERDSIPSHIGIILDGNRRWAANKGVSREGGHKEGADRVEQLLDWCHDLKVKTVTLYVLSTENLARPSEEVEELLSLLEDRFTKLLSDERVYRYRVKVKAIGQLDLLPDGMRKTLAEIEEKTRGFDGLYLNIAVAYGGRAEITDVVRSIAQDVKQGSLTPDKISEETISRKLYTSYLPNQEPDLIIRTSGEERMSGFLLWQGAYSELVFVDVFWPAFRKIDLMRAIRTYQRRTRRYGR
ncbi:MAG TPA: polyprenyl diphosphate synthase [Nitrososphaerales archaeon]|nr:polyprenyl diphosphate synthase [Nitrososphaerales archaeon]